MANSLLENKLAELKLRRRRQEDDVFLAEILDVENGIISWSVSEENDDIYAEIMRLSGLTFSCFVGIESDAEVSLAKFFDGLNIERYASVLISVMLPEYRFTDWLRMDAAGFRDFVLRFLFHRSAIVFLLRTSEDTYVFGNQDGDFGVHSLMLGQGRKTHS